MPETRANGDLPKYQQIVVELRRCIAVGRVKVGDRLPSETEIFDPMCQGMARAGRIGGHALLWGHSTHASDEDKQFLAHQLCDDYIARHVSGVFFAPLEGFKNKDAVNHSIAERLSAAGIAVVLLDRCIDAWPKRSRFDVVCI